MLTVILLIISGAAAEAAVPAVWRASHSLFIAGAVHLTAAFLVAGGVHAAMRRLPYDEVRPVLFYGVLVTLFFPLIGLPAAFLMVLGVRIFGGRFRASVYEEYEQYVSEKEISSSIAGEGRNVLRNIRKEISFEPYADIVRWGDITSKMKVIGKLSGSFAREDVSLLREAVHDPSPEVRFYASGALLKLESRISERITRAEQSVKRRGGAEDYSDLGDMYRLYVTSGLSPEELTGYYILLACDAYQNSFDINTDQPDLVVAYAQSLFDIRNYRRASALLDHAVKIWPEHAEISFLRGEVYFRLGDLREVFRNFADTRTDGLDETRREAVKTWTPAA